MSLSPTGKRGGSQGENTSITTGNESLIPEIVWVVWLVVLKDIKLHRMFFLSFSPENPQLPSRILETSN